MDKLIILSGPSGAGKSTLLKKLFGEFRDKFGFSVSYTSRKPRNGEVDGTDYHFVTEDEFKTKISNDDFIEWACVHGNYYGTAKDEVNAIMSRGLYCILDIDVQGAMNIKSRGIEARYIFISPGSIDVLKERLLIRGTDSIEDIEKRIKNAEKELTYMNFYDYIIVNDMIDNSYQKLVEYIFS